MAKFIKYKIKEFVYKKKEGSQNELISMSVYDTLYSKEEAQKVIDKMLKQKNRSWSSKRSSKIYTYEMFEVDLTKDIVSGVLKEVEDELCEDYRYNTYLVLEQEDDLDITINEFLKVYKDKKIKITIEVLD